MYKYSESQEERIRKDREALKRYQRNKRIIRAAARGGAENIPGEVLKRAKAEAGAAEKYFEGLSGETRIIFESHYKNGVSLAIVGDLIGRSGNSCADLIRRQLATVSLDGKEGEAAKSRRNRSKRRRGKQQA